jgi:hypothetical protein
MNTYCTATLHNTVTCLSYQSCHWLLNVNKANKANKETITIACAWVWDIIFLNSRRIMGSIDTGTVARLFYNVGD